MGNLGPKNNKPLDLLSFFVVSFMVIIVLQIPKASGNPWREDLPCESQKCHPFKPGMINVHIICHTHLDTGWTKTFDEYYITAVREIFESIAYHIPKGRDRRFILVETSFFARWWSEQSEHQRRIIRNLVNSGQLEFISGGWSMNDEACPRYQTIIDQLTLGHKWLNDTFGHCAIPSIGWQIDPFGHSREFASILAQMGFKGLFLGRIDYQDKAERQRKNLLEFVWKSSPSIGKKVDLFTSILPNVYWPPDGFCYDRYCPTEDVGDHNVNHKAKSLINLIKNQAKFYETNHTIITMGMDFQWTDAGRWFANLDPLIAAINSMQSTEHVNVFYSTPSCYLRALHQSRREWPVKMDDFFPYADQFNVYWTGFFTSRPALKYHVRYANNFLQAAKQLNTLANAGNSELDQSMDYRALQEALGILSHHDAITGTCQQHVNDDYTRMLSEGIHKAEKAITSSMNRLLYPRKSLTLSSEPVRHHLYLNRYSSGQSRQMHFCHLINISQCEIVQDMRDSESLTLHIFNPVANPIKSYIRLPIFGSSYTVINSESTRIVTQVAELSTAVQNLPKRVHNSSLELIFRVNLPPLGYSSYTLRKLSTPSFYQRAASEAGASPDITIKNGKFVVTIDARTGLMKELILSKNRRIPLKQYFHAYTGEVNYIERHSGAYAFNPLEKEPTPVGNKVTFKVIKGPLVEEIHQVFNPWISQVIRVYQHVDYIEFDWVVGPIPVSAWRAESGQEIVSVFDTDLRSNGTFFTDSNGRETIRRVRDHRFTWQLDATENVASNYYPVSSWIFIRDYEKNLQLTVIPDRAQGGSSMKDGRVEMMVHRRLLRDDGFGVDQALNEPGEDDRGLVVRGRHYVIVDDIRTSVQKTRILARSFANKPILMFQTERVSDSDNADLRSEFIGLNRKLPLNINLLSLERWSDNQVLVRLEHIFEVNEDPKYSRPRRVSLRDLFSPMRAISAKEVTLNGLTDKSEADKRHLHWRTQSDPYFNYTNQLTQIEPSEPGHRESSDSMVVILYPMEIRTYLIMFEKV